MPSGRAWIAGPRPRRSGRGRRSGLISRLRPRSRSARVCCHPAQDRRHGAVSGRVDLVVGLAGDHRGDQVIPFGLMSVAAGLEPLRFGAQQVNDHPVVAVEVDIALPPVGMMAEVGPGAGAADGIR